MNITTVVTTIKETGVIYIKYADMLYKYLGSLFHDDKK